MKKSFARLLLVSLTLIGCNASVTSGDASSTGDAGSFPCGDAQCEGTQICIADRPCMTIYGDGGACPAGYQFVPTHACIRQTPVYSCAAAIRDCADASPCSCVANPGSDGTCTTADGRTAMSPGGCF